MSMVTLGSLWSGGLEGSLRAQRAGRAPQSPSGKESAACTAAIALAHSNAETLRDLILAATRTGRLVFWPRCTRSYSENARLCFRPSLICLRTLKPDPASRTRATYINIQGVRAQENADFRNKAIFISDFLDINETKAVHILNEALALQSRWDKDPVSTAVIVYHLERSKRLDCLVSLLQGSNRARPEVSRNLFNQHLADLLPATGPVLPGPVLPSPGSGGGSSAPIRPSSLGIPYPGFNQGSRCIVRRRTWTPGSFCRQYKTHDTVPIDLFRIGLTTVVPLY
ncbi:hypothetical protein BJ742DRAFT_781477 [Cladochytrium replicatum]|nr:hypothetical protein BJ742DRAFT_781477 [Cladochytrium replicatum]